MSSTNTPPRTWLISGANTGLGLELTLVALSHGEKVIAAMRTPSKAPDVLKSNTSVHIIPFDLSWDQDRMDAFAAEAFAVFGRIDVLVNMAAYAFIGGIEESTDADLQSQFDINVFAPTRLIRAALPYLRTQGSGTIVNMSSVGGMHSYPGNALYCSTKFALEALTFALAEEIASFGLKALVIQPGYFRTEFLANPTAGINSAKPMKVYEGTVVQEARDAIPKYNGKQPGDPKKGAVRMWEGITGEGLAKGKKHLGRIPLGNDTGAMMRTKGQELLDTADEWEDIWSSTDIVE